MPYDYSVLKGKITEICGTRGEFAKKMGLSERSISLKLNNKLSWSQSDIQRALEILGVSSNKVQEYFFTLKVQSY